jgi:hypothetical protein
MRLVLLAVVAVAVYAGLCAWRPLARCRSCRGTLVRTRRGPRLILWWLDRLRGPKLCRRCGATGRRIRYGRRAYDHLRRLQRAGSR